ncbi:hypothetical protein E2C01_012577 [Portunus trituberculatus]|uniref:Uncharacterized protein n=1 Tax=Portunus trituberculatus TaxID=210409 RepID=A0A5B7DE34_PORTR|nr:hypothetical protein [Portunus trituberculatus]
MDLRERDRLSRSVVTLVWQKLVVVAILFLLHNPRPNKPPTGLPPSFFLLFLLNAEQFIRVIPIGVLLQRHHVARHALQSGKSVGRDLLLGKRCCGTDGCCCGIVMIR